VTMVMKIAIASSGLGHVARGVETWALDTAVAVSDYRPQTTDPRLESADQGKEQSIEQKVAKDAKEDERCCACGGNAGSLVHQLAIPAEAASSPLPPLRSSRASVQISSPLSVTLFCAAPLPSTVHCPPSTVVLRCLKRGDVLTRRLLRIMPGFTWRWGLKDPYGWEQLTFWLLLWPKLRKGKFDILHVQDPMVAYWCRLFRKWGLVRTKEILAHGTEEPVEFLNQFDYVQQLAPWHLKQTIDHRPQTPDLKGNKWTAIPNFVDCEVFKPNAGGRQAIRANLGIPENAFVVGCVAAVKKHHKRIDYLINEFARLANRQVKQEEEFEQKPTKHTKEIGYSADMPAGAPAHSRTQEGGGEEYPPSCSSRASVQHSFPLPFLLIAGAKTDETDELRALAESLIPGRYKIMTDLGRARMPDLYRCMDVFVLTSLFEMMPIALLEALASGVPCLVNKHPVVMWMIGAEGARPQTADHGLQAIVRRGEGVNHEGHEERQEEGGGDKCPAFGGMVVDMGREGALAGALAGVTPEWVAAAGQQARERAVGMFSTEAVIGQYVEYYRLVVNEGGR
jgi:glycosyltransferase involved in cell wall biosynthesis